MFGLKGGVMVRDLGTRTKRLNNGALLSSWVNVGRGNKEDKGHQLKGQKEPRN